MSWFQGVESTDRFYDRIKETLMGFMSWLSIAGICFLGAACPGPSLAVVMRHTVRGSRRNGMATGMAHCLGVGFYALLTVSGLAALLALEPSLQKGVVWGGGAYLAWLGIKALRSNGASLGESISADKTGMLEAARDGLMISLLNPKLMIFFLALFSQFVSPHMGRTVSLVMVLTPLLIDGAWFCLVAVLLSRRRLLDWLRKHARLIDRITGTILLVVALRVLTL